MASEHKIGITVKDGTTGGGAGTPRKPAGGDSAAIKTLINVLERTLSKNAKENASTIEKALRPLLKEVLRGSTGGKEVNLDRVVKGMGSEIVKEINRSLSRTASGGKTTGTGDVSKAIDKGMNNLANKLSRTLSSRVSETTGAKIDERALANSLVNGLKPLLPKTVGQPRELQSVVDSLKTISREISSSVRSIKTAAASGGKLDINEIPKVMSELKELSKSLSSINKEATKAKEAFSKIATDLPDIKDFNRALGSIKGSATKSVKGAVSSEAFNPKALVREITGNIVADLKKTAAKDPQLGPAIKKLEAAADNLGKFSAEFKKIRSSAGSKESGSKFSLEGADKLAQSFNKFTNTLNKIPTDIGFAKMPEAVKGLIEGLDQFASKAAKITSKVKVVVDDSDLKKIADTVLPVKAKIAPETTELKKIEDKPLEIPATLDASSLKNEVSKLRKAALDAAHASMKENLVNSIFNGMNASIDKGDLDSVARSLNKLTELKLDVDVDKAANEIRKLTGVFKAELSSISKDIAQQAEKTLKQTATSIQKQNIAKNPRRLDSYKQYSSKTLMPRADDSYTDKLATRAVSKAKAGPGISKQAIEIQKAAEANLANLEKSLTNLQTRIVTTLDKQFSEAGKKWAVVKSPQEKDPRKAFKLTTGDRQWSLDIANVEQLQKATKQFGLSVDKLVSTYEKQEIGKAVATTDTPKRSELVGQWLKTVSADQIRGRDDLDDITKSRLVKIKEANAGVKVSDDMRQSIRDIFGDVNLEKVFKDTYAKDLAKRRMRESGLVKSLALPAAQKTATKDPFFRTTHGSQRALPKFVKYDTGFENLYKQIVNVEKEINKGQKGDALKRAIPLQSKVRSMGVRPEGPKAEELSKEMFMTLEDLKKKTTGGAEEVRGLMAKAYSKAGKFKGVDLEAAGKKSLEEFDNEVATHIAKFQKLGGANQSAEKFIKHMEQLNLSAADAVKALSTIKSMNVYDMITSVLDKGESSPLKTVGKQPYFERSVREFDKAISQVESTLPLFESNRPRRAYHQENVANVFTRTGDLYSSTRASENRLDPKAQKKFIKDLNIEFNELFKKADKIGREVVGVPTDIRKLSTLGIPESQAGNVEQFRTGGLATGKTKYINKLEATSVKMYAEDLTELAPFQQFQQAGRNIANVTNAVVAPNTGFETPKLRSERERDLIQSGRYGKGGYGLNVVAELRNTAANFEDQIVISGKLAKSMTEAVKILVKPSQLGRTTGATEEDLIRGTGVTEISTGEIDKVTKKFMEILGAPEEYKGRADKALIQDVKKAVAVVRGEKVEVQQAKLVETFLNSFGRKLTTRYGSKGVSVTPTGQPDNLLEILAKYGEKSKIKVKPEDTLGYQVAPKSVGQIASELFGKEVSQEFKDKLITYGNKFMIDIFQNADIVDPKEAENAKLMYEKFSKAWADVFGGEVPKVGVEGIKQIRSKAEEKGIGLTDIRPIEVRISSYGAAKRGLQTEFMEAIFSNVAGAGNLGARSVPGGESTPMGTTTLRKLQQKDYERLLGGPGQKGALAKYSEALGYKGAGKSQEQLAPELFKLFGGKGDYAEKLSEKDSKALLAQRAAAVEAVSSYYSTVVDEFGKERPGLVGEKFLKIIEESNKNPEWQREQVERGTKGARLNLPAFSAYETVFGEASQGSKFMQELEKSLDINATKHWEYMKALQTIHGKDSDIYQKLTKDLDTVDIGEVRPFYKSTGVYDREVVADAEGKETISPRSFADTILDVQKYATPFKLKTMGGTIDEKTGKPVARQEELYIPGALARGTYDEPLIAGERGMDQIARRMSHMVNMAKELDLLFRDPDAAMKSMTEDDSSKLSRNISTSVGKMVARAKTLGKSSDPAAAEELQQMIKTLEPLISDVRIDPRLMSGPGGRGETERQFFQKRKASEAEKMAGGRPVQFSRANLVRDLGDLIIGKSKDSGEYDPQAATVVSRAADTGSLGSLGMAMGPELLEEMQRQKIESFQKAKIDYYNTLAETATGKSGSINELLFSRKIPAVMAKATVAVVDKKKDIETFQKRLSKYNEAYGLGLDDQVSTLSTVAKEHGEAISKYKKVGIPVLSQDELGVPETFAEKIPLEFLKKYDVGKSGEISDKQQPEVVKSTLAGMLKFIEKLREAAEGQPERQQEIENYINESLVPYIESIRFPFTGSSSIAPFKPTLLKEGTFKDQEGRALDKNTIMVPGIPEGLESLAPVVEAVQKRIDSLVVEREKEQTAGSSPEVIAEFTKMIRELNAAISDVIPKYVAQAQKLDFDGDQIEIHAAKTAGARKDIEKHFKRFHMASPTGDIKAQDTFMKRFLSDAASVKTTGSYVFGESAGAFEKKFPSEKGFKFMQTPFLTEDLEYLNSREALSALEGNPNVGGLGNLISDILPKIEGVEQKDVTELVNKIDDMGADKKGMPLADAIMSLVEAKYKESNAEVLVDLEKGIKDRLYKEKMGDTIEAQLYKIHTGVETEGMYRVHRLAESTAGFGGGLIGGQRNSSEYFKKRFPETKALGKNPEEEFHTMVNEFLRFGVQKGMDVKHAGEKPIAGEMVNYLAKGVQGAEDLWGKISDEDNKTFGDLRDFSGDIEKTIRMRLGELSNDDILGEAKKIASSRGESTAGLDNKTREELIKIIVEQVGFKGFLEEMSILLEKEAVASLTKLASEWSPKKRQKFFKGFYKPGDDVASTAAGRIKWEQENGGIQLQNYLAQAKSPLYTTRGFFGSPHAERTKYEDRFGKIQTPKDEVSAIDETSAFRYKESYAKAKATAANIQRELKSFSKGDQTGAYADMVSSTIEALHEQQSMIEKYAKQIDSVASTGQTPQFIADVLSSGKEMQDKIEELSDLAGVPYMSATEKFDIEAQQGAGIRDKRLAEIKASEKYKSGEISSDQARGLAEDYTAKEIKKLQAKEQLRRVSKAIMARRGERGVLDELMPTPDKAVDFSYSEARRKQYQKAQAAVQADREKAGFLVADTIARDEVTEPPGAGGTGGPRGPAMSLASGEVVKVHLVGADASAVVSVNVLKSAGFISSTPSPADVMSSRKGVLDDVLKSLEAEKGPARSTAEYYSPSRLSGGGDTYGKGKKKAFTEAGRQQEQLAQLIESMTSDERNDDPAFNAIVDWGTVLHAKLQKYFEGQGNYDIERYKSMEDAIGGVIGGTADLVEYESADKQKVSKIIDIKSTTGGILDRLQEGKRKAGGSSDINDIIENVDNELKRKLNDYFSQLNAYLKIFDESATAELRFYDKAALGKDPNAYEAISIKYDPARFEKDMQQLAKAREAVKQSGKAFTEIKNVPMMGVAQTEKWPEAEELVRAMKEAKDRLADSSHYTKRRSREDDEMTNQYGIDMEQRAAELGKQKMYERLGPKDLEKYLVPPKIAAGNDVPALAQNLETMHSQSKIYQKMKGLDMETLNTMPKEIGDALSQISETGPDPKAFIELTGKLKDMERPDFTHGQFLKAWKLYRITVGDYMIAKAKEAEAQMNSFAEAGDEKAAGEAYGDFENATRRLQEFIRRSIGKPTDIYTDDKRFVYPGLAKAADVFMTPEQIHNKVGQGLGDDPKLIEKFRDITKGLQQSEMPSPVESAKASFADLSDMRSDMVDLLNDADRFSRLGPEVLEAWDFEKLATRATRLREALEQVKKQAVDMDATQKKNLENNIKLMKSVEGLYSHRDFNKKSGYGQTNIMPVPKFVEPEVQRAMHKRNIQSVREYFKKPAAGGGPEIGERFSYSEKITGEAGETIKNVVHNFRKYGEELDKSGNSTGKFAETQQDLIEKMQRTSASFGNAVRRVVMWGAASRLVYGGISNLKSSLNELANIEVGIASLRMVMSPLETDFAKMSKSATGLAKQYGVPVTDVLKSMKVFAQQGLKQGEVIDRTETATLASNVTTLNAKEATEALTSAMKIFREEGSQSVRFLDAWSEVEAKHAITAEDMANAIKKSAAAAKAAGVQFDQLNGMVAAVGAVTRQTGKEVGTSFRFIFRRLFSEEGPKALAKMNIPTIDEAGELRPAFEILGDLAGQWKDLSAAQRLNVAQSIGGTRQYNSLLVLMDQWDEVLRGVKNSTNSKGSAERRNAEIMKTYAKQLERTRAAATEFKMEIGKIALPVFTAGTKGITLLLEALTAIPAPVKVAAAALAGFFTLGAKGINAFDGVSNFLDQAGSLFGEFSGQFGKQMSIAKYEIFGKKDKDLDIFGLKTMTPTATKNARGLAKNMSSEMKKSLTFTSGDGLVTQGKSLSDFQSIFAKGLYGIMEAGRAYNSLLGEMAVATGAVAESAGEAGQEVGAFFSSVVDIGEAGSKGGGGFGIKKAFDIYDGLKKLAKTKGLGGEAVKQTFKEAGFLKGLGKVAGKATLYAGEVGGAATYLAGQAIDSVGEQIGGVGQKVLKDFTTQNTGFIKSVAPMALAIAGLVPAIKATAEYFGKMTGSAADFDKSMEGIRRKQESSLGSVRDMIQEYDALEKKVGEINKAEDPKVKARRQELGTYESPLTTLQDVQTRSIDLSNRIASSNADLVVGYDKLGNAVLKTSSSFKTYLKQIENLEIQEGVATELEVLGKYLDDLSSGNKSENIKQAFKELAEAFPVLGNLAARNIKVSPAKQLEMASEDLNKRLNLKQKYPISAAADADIERLQEALGKARGAYQETFIDMSRTYGKVLSRSNLKGLNKDQIKDIINSPELRKAYEMQIKIDPRFKLVEGITPEDIMGKELLSALNPNLAGQLDVAAEFTKANLESSGFVERKGKAASGDVVTFYKDMADEYNIAGRQAVVKLKDTDEWVVEYFNTRTLELEQRSLSDVEGMVDSILPIEKIKEDLSFRMDSLNTFVAGASAGLSGISKKDFKRDFNLGERFFGEIPTTTLLQGNKGFTPGVGFGEVEAMKDFGKDIQEYFFKPMEELRRKTETFEKLQLEGIEKGSTTINKEFYDEINKLLDVLKNNQVVLQFRAVFVDLMKEMANGQRILKEEIAVMRKRSELNVRPGGLSAGSPLDLENLDLGIRNIRDLNPRQRLLAGDRGFRQGAVQLRERELASQSNLDMIDKLERALVQVEDIANVAEGFGASLSPDELGKYIEKVVPERGEGPMYELKKIDQGIEKNTASTVDRLDKLLENQGDPEAINKLLSSFVDNISSGATSPGKTVQALERVAGIRGRAEKRGDQETVMASNKALDVLTKQLVAQVGYKKGMDMVDKNFTIFSKKFKPEEFQQRAFGGIDGKVFMERLKKYAPEKSGFFGIGSRDALANSKQFKSFEEIQQKQYKQGVFSSKNLARVALVSSALGTIQKSGNKKIIDQLDDQINILDERLTTRRDAGASSKELASLGRRREGLSQRKAEKQAEAEFYGAAQAIGGTTFAVTELAKSFGLTENSVMALGTAAAGLYTSLLIASKVTGQKLPESAKKFGEELKKAAGKTARGEGIGVADKASIALAAKGMTDEFKSRQKEIFGSKTKDIRGTIKEADLEKAAEEIKKAVASQATSMEEFRAKGPDFKKYADMQKKQIQDRFAFLKDNKGDRKGYDDLKKSQRAEREDFLRKLDRNTKDDILTNYNSARGIKLGASGKDALGPGLENVGASLVRGLEKAEGPSKLKQLIVAYLATGLADYASNKSADKTALAGTEKIMQAQSEAFGNLLAKYPDAAEKVLAEMQQDASRVVEEAASVTTIDKSLVQNTEDAKSQITSQIKDLQDHYVKEQKKAMEEQRRIQAQLADQEARESVKMAQEQSAREARSSMGQSNLARRFSLTNVLNRSLQGFSGDVELPIRKEDMSTQQRIYAEASAGYKKVVDEYAAGIQQLDRMRTAIGMLKDEAASAADIASTSSDDDEVRRAKERFKDLQGQIKDAAKVTEEFGNKLSKLGKLRQVMNEFVSSVNKLNAAVKEVGLSEYAEDLPGRRRFTEMNERLLGGPDPDAIISLNTEQIRMGDRVGVPLRRGEATQWDLRLAELKDQFSKTDDGEQRSVIARQIRDLPYQREIVRQDYNQRKFDERQRRQIQPFTEMQDELIRVRTNPNLSEDAREQVTSAISQLDTIIGRSLERIPVAQLAERLSKSDSPEDKSELAALNKMLSTSPGIPSTYRGILDSEQKGLMGTLGTTRKTLEAEGVALSVDDELAQSINRPIVDSISDTNTILRSIAEKEFGIDFDPSLFKTMGDRGEKLSSRASDFFKDLFPDSMDLGKYIKEKIINLVDSMFGFEKDRKPTEKAGGGSIAGPGTATSDSIPALLSDGEYVIRTSSVNKIGKHTLDYINSYGKVPGFASGGFADYLKEERLKKAGDLSLGSLISQGGLAATEIATRMMSAPMDMLNAMGSMDAKTVNAMVEGAKSKGFLGTLKGVGQGMGSAFMDDIKTGGTGMTAGILSALIPSGALAKAATKVPTKGMTQLERVVRNYGDILPGVTGKNIGKIATGDLSGLGKAGADGAYYAADIAGLGGKSKIMLDKALSPGKRVDKLTHELFHDFTKEGGVLYDYINLTKGGGGKDLAPFMKAYGNIKDFSTQLGGKELSSEIISDAFMPTNAGSGIGKTFRDMLEPIKKSGGMRNEVKAITDSADFAKFRKDALGFASGGSIDYQNLKPVAFMKDPEEEVAPEEKSWWQKAKDRTNKYLESFNSDEPRKGNKSWSPDEYKKDLDKVFKYASGGSIDYQNLKPVAFMKDPEEELPPEDKSWWQKAKDRTNKYLESFNSDEPRKGNKSWSPDEYKKDLDDAFKFDKGGPVRYFTAYGDDMREYGSKEEYNLGKAVMREMYKNGNVPTNTREDGTFSGIKKGLEGIGVKSRKMTPKDLDEQGRPIHYYTAYGDDIKRYTESESFKKALIEKGSILSPSEAGAFKPGGISAEVLPWTSPHGAMMPAGPISVKGYNSPEEKQSSIMSDAASLAKDFASYYMDTAKKSREDFIANPTIPFGKMSKEQSDALKAQDKKRREQMGAFVFGDKFKDPKFRENYWSNVGENFKGAGLDILDKAGAIAEAPVNAVEFLYNTFRAGYEEDDIKHAKEAGQGLSFRAPLPSSRTPRAMTRYLRGLTSDEPDGPFSMTRIGRGTKRAVQFPGKFATYYAPEAALGAAQMADDYLGVDEERAMKAFNAIQEQGRVSREKRNKFFKEMYAKFIEKASKSGVALGKKGQKLAGKAKRYASGGRVKDPIEFDWGITTATDRMRYQRELARGEGKADMTGRDAFMGLGAQWQTDQLARADQSKKLFNKNLAGYRASRDRSDYSTNALGAYLPKEITDNKIFKAGPKPFVRQMSQAMIESIDAMQSDGFSKLDSDEQKQIRLRAKNLNKLILDVNSGVNPFTKEFQKKAMTAMRGKGAAYSTALYREYHGLDKAIEDIDPTVAAAIRAGVATGGPKEDENRINPFLGQANAKSAGIAKGGGLLSGVSNVFDTIKKFMDDPGDFFEFMKYKDKQAKYSATQMHSGGIVAKTGKIFAEAGEVVMPKKLANGGFAAMESTGASSSMSMDFSPLQEAVSKLESLELKVEDKLLAVDTSKPVPVDLTQPVPVDLSTPISVDLSQPISVDTSQPVPVDLTQPISVDISQPVPVDISKPVPVDLTQPVPVDTSTPVSIDLDTTAAATSLSSAIKTALDGLESKLSSATSGPSAVGGDLLNEVDRKVAEVHDKLFTEQVRLSNEIKQLGSTDQKSIDMDAIGLQIKVAVANSTGPISQELNDIRTELSRVSSSQRRGEVTIETKLEQMKYEMNIAQNQVGTTGIGRYNIG